MHPHLLLLLLLIAAILTGMRGNTYWKYLKTFIYKDVCTPMFIAIICTVAEA